MPRRRSGSVRFDPYFKVQFYNERQLAWQDVQRAFDTPEAAEAAVAAGEIVPPPQCNTAHRLIHVGEHGRAPFQATTWARP